MTSLEETTAVPRHGEPGDGDGPLAGIRVVEVTTLLQGPISGQVLAALGADVIKIEQVGTPDVSRNFVSFFGVELDGPNLGWSFATLNRGKRSLALDVRAPDGQAAFHQLVARADVFLSNLRESGLRVMGADYETLREVNPRLVYALGGGLGPRGPLAQNPCMDLIGMAYSGFLDNVSANGQPVYPPGSLSDVITGTNLAAGVMAALVRRSVSGRGARVETSQLQSMLWTQIFPVGLMASVHERVQRYTASDDDNPVLRTYPTSDGYIAVAVIRPRQWPELLRVLNLSHLLEDPRFASFKSIMEHRRDVAQILADKLSTRSTKEWMALFAKEGVWHAPVNTFESVTQDEQVLANDYLNRYPDGAVAPGLPFSVDGWRDTTAVAAEYGGDTDTVLHELGYDDEAIVNMRVKGIVW
jgi:crotonobetainyl-CoA:carnitine CoA-transferase CaiB-like acyl-CoA transferase